MIEILFKNWTSHATPREPPLKCQEKSRFHFRSLIANPDDQNLLFPIKNLNNQRNKALKTHLLKKQRARILCLKVKSSLKFWMNKS